MPRLDLSGVSVKQEIYMSKALELAEEIRKDHNGIMSVNLYMGHDGHNVCILKDYDKVLARGESGRCLLEAIEKAYRNWRIQGYLSFHKAENLAKKTTELFGDPCIFNTSSVQAIIKEDTDYDINVDVELIPYLTNCLRIVRLEGGCHWMLLPENYKRYN